MMNIVRSWQLPVGCLAAGVAAVVGFSGAVAAAEPVLPPPPVPGQAQASAPMVTQTVPAPTTAAPGSGGTAGATAAPGSGAAATRTAAPSTLVPASSGTLREYFAEKEVQLEPQQPGGFTALDITLPVPPGWTQVPDPNVPDAFAVIADRRSSALYTPNAQVVVYRLLGDFDPKEAITHGYLDCQTLPAWRTTNASLADLGEFPSSAIEGTYRQNDMTLNTSQRHVIATSGENSYLVSATVTTDARESVGNAPATNGIINGFRVAAPGSAPTATPPATSSAPATSTTSAVPHASGVPPTVPVSPTAPGPASPPPMSPLPGPAMATSPRG